MKNLPITKCFDTTGAEVEWTADLKKRVAQSVEPSFTLNLYPLKNGKQSGTSCGSVTNVRLVNGDLHGDITLRDTPSGNLGGGGQNLALLVYDGDLSKGVPGYLYYQTNILGIGLLPSTVAETSIDHLCKKLRGDGPEGTRFASIVEKHRKAGAKNPFSAALLESPEAYNEYRRAFSRPDAPQMPMKPTRENPEKIITKFNAEVVRLELKGVPRATAIIQIAKEQPELFNKAKATGKI